MIDKSGIFYTTFTKPTWLFKQSTYGGVEHIMADVDVWSAYIQRRNIQEPFKVETVCGKFLKNNLTFSIVRCITGRANNICLDCLMGNESEEKAEEAARKDSPIESLRKRYGDDPF